MRKLFVGTFLTLDGVMQAPGGPDEDPESGFEHGGWQAPVFDDEVGEAVGRWFDEADALLLGRKTYEIFAGYWPSAPPDNPFTAKINDVQKYVASRTLQTVEWQNTTLLPGDAADAVRELKETDGGDINVSGSGNLIQTLMRHDLVDEYRLIVHPVILGTGKRLFDNGAVPTSLAPVACRTTSTGNVIAVYRPAGKPSYGTF